MKVPTFLRFFAISMALLIPFQASAADLNTSKGSDPDSECPEEEEECRLGADVSISGYRSNCPFMDHGPPAPGGQSGVSQDAAVLIECHQANYPAERFQTENSLPRHAALRILELDGSEVDDICYSEGHPDLKWITLQLDAENLVAKIRRFSEDPAGGRIELEINHVNFAINSAHGQTFAELNTLVHHTLATRFDVQVRGDYFMLTTDLETRDGITRVYLGIEDDDINRTEVALEPLNFVPTTDCAGW